MSLSGPSVWSWAPLTWRRLCTWRSACENARVALQRDYVSTAAAAYGGGGPSVQSVLVSEGLQRAVEKLNRGHAHHESGNERTA